MRKNASFIFLCGLLLCFAACQKDTSQTSDAEVIASVNNSKLYRVDIERILPRGLSKKDSVAAAKLYVKTWIEEELLYDKAKKNTPNQAKIDEFVGNYKRSLIVNTYQEALLKELLTNTIPESELKAYYEQNRKLFDLKENIIKGLYLKIPATSPQLKTFEKWYKTATDQAVEVIEKNTLQNAVDYDYFYNRWVSLEDITSNIPLAIANNEQFLQANKSIDVRDSSFVYLLNIKEYMLIGKPAPYEYIKPQLTTLFLEQKKGAYLQKIKEDLYKKAVERGEVNF